MSQGLTSPRIIGGTIDLLKAGTITTIPNTPGGTLGLVTTVSNLTNGSVVMTGGTLTVIPNTPGGTLALVTRVGNVGTIEVGTISTMPNVPGGTLALVTAVTTVANLTNGSIKVTAGTEVVTGGTLDLLTTVSNLSNGSIKVTAGTEIITSGSINVIAGTVSAGTINIGTVMGNTGTGVALPTSSNPFVIAGTSATNGTVFAALIDSAGHLIMNVNTGSIAVSAGTVSAGTVNVGTITAGTINTGTVNAGTINVGTITAGSIIVTAGTVAAGSIVVTVGTIAAGSIVVTTGTVVSNGGTAGRIDARPRNTVLSFATTSTGTIGTLVAAPSAGSSIFLTSLKVNVQNGTAEPVISFALAATGAGVVDRGNYSAQGGVTRSYSPASSFNNTGTALTWNVLSGSGTVSIDGTYFIDVP